MCKQEGKRAKFMYEITAKLYANRLHSLDNELAKLISYTSTNTQNKRIPM